MEKRTTHPIFSGSIECYDDYGVDTFARGKYLVLDDTGKHQWTDDLKKASELLAVAFEQWEESTNK